VLARGADRDWIYAPDAADAFVAMLEAARPPAVAVNVTPGALWPLERMAVALAAQFPGFRWRHAAPGEASNLGYGGPIDRPRRPLSAARARELFGWSAAHGPDAACADYARWLAARAL
jgi:UDP-glucose 4-epimerase